MAMTCGHAIEAIIGAHDLGAKVASVKKTPPSGTAVVQALMRYKAMKNSSLPAQKVKRVVCGIC